MCGSNHNRFGELFVGRDLVCEFDNHKLSGRNTLLASRYEVNKLLSSQCLSQDLETRCLKLSVVNFLDVQIFKGDHNILIFQP